MVKVSQHGLLACPGCQRFVKAARPLLETVCPFCSRALARHEDGEGEAVGRRGFSRRGKALLAAALLGSAFGLAGCPPPPTPPYGIAPYGIPPIESTPQEPPPTDGGTHPEK